MSEEKLNAFWEQVKHVGKVERLQDDAMLVLGSIFGQMETEIKKQREVIDFYADERNYDSRHGMAILKDCGDKAREGLK